MYSTLKGLITNSMHASWTKLLLTTKKRNMHISKYISKQAYHMYQQYLLQEMLYRPTSGWPRVAALFYHHLK